MNFPLLSKERTITDPIHKVIRIRHQVIADLLMTHEVQRLHSIHQLGGAFFLYPGATHSRFSHSLGTYHLADMMTSQQAIVDVTTEQERVQIMIAALLHDIGHGFLSHAFESVHHVNHERYTVNLITKESGVHDILAKVDPQLTSIIASIIDHSHPRPLFWQIISSQIDADRMDYLLRDAYFSGLPYGVFDLQRIFIMLKVIDDQLVFRSSALAAIENFFTGRYHMYQQLYFHPMSVSFEALVSQWCQRLFFLMSKNKPLKNDYSLFKLLTTGEALTNAQHQFFDDNTILEAIKDSIAEDDPVLVDLATRFQSRRFFDYRYLSKGEAERLSAAERGIVVEVKSVLYNRRVSRREPIMVLMGDGTLAELSTVSPIVKATGSIDSEYLYIDCPGKSITKI